ncbi:uncharacterized protein LOC117544984 isoform X3 [Gymnodraco acuticeps]|uniref:Uncharacterized protein LOC117544984 isoform X3 n=1 Tax=Gymnodraco acuticeps TaxID=8218 RepID=A0A6P8U1A5_GYMAC|nr:uncharacterized protein LOC117544984 isoform X3 [Gymnodraco acuticeps]
MHREAERTPEKMSARQSVRVLDALLEKECLPEVTFLDDTCDSFLHGGMPATPVTAGSLKSWITSLQPSQLTSSPNSNTTTEIIRPLNKSMDLSQSDVNISKVDNYTCNTKWDGMKKLSEIRSIDSKSDKENNKGYSPVLSRHAWTTSNDSDDKMKDISESICAPLGWQDYTYLTHTNITLLDVTRDSELSQVEDLSSTDETQETPVANMENNQPPSEFSEQRGTEPDRSYMVPREELSSTSTITGHVTHTTISFSEKSDKSVEKNITQTFLEVTQNISSSSVFENSRPSLEPIGPNMVKIETSAEKTFGTHPANVTHDLSSSSDMSAKCAASQLSTSDGKCNTSLKNVTSELHVEPVLDCNSVEANDKSLTSHDAEVTTKETQPSPKTSGSVNSMSANGTFTSLQPSQSSSSTDLNATAEITSPQNKTLDLPPSDVNSCKAKSQVTVDATSVINNTIEGSQNQNYSTVNASGPGNMVNATFPRHSLKTSSAGTILVESGAGTFCLENNTFDAKLLPKQNGTMTLSESGPRDRHQGTFDKPSLNATSSPKANTSNAQCPKLVEQNRTTDTDPIAKMATTSESKLEAYTAVVVNSGADQRRTQDLSQSGLPVMDVFSDSLAHQSMDMARNANTFNLDDTLDFKVESWITSTPMPTKEEGKILGGVKKLHEDGPIKPDGQVSSEVPSSLVCDRKTFMKLVAAKSLFPPLKAASQLFKHKTASALPGRFEAQTYGQTMTRQRTEALRNTVAAVAAAAVAAAAAAPTQIAGISSSYKLRATTGSKQPNSGLQRPQLSGIPTGIQRAATGLRPLFMRNNTSFSNTNKLRGPAASSPGTKTSQGKRQPLTRDTSFSSGNTEASKSSCDTANGIKTLKRPTATKRALPAFQREGRLAVALYHTVLICGAAVLASTAAEIPPSCAAVSRAKALKLPATSHRTLFAKPKDHGCANCAVLEQQLKMQSEVIRRLKEAADEK